MQCRFFPDCWTLIHSSHSLRITGKRSMKGRLGLDQGKIPWRSDRMCLVTHSLFLPAQITRQGHTRENRGWRKMEEAWVCVCVSDARGDISSPSFAWRDSGTHSRCQQHWQHHQQTVAVPNTHTQTYMLSEIAAEPLEKNTPNVFRKLHCPRRENNFSLSSQTNKQQHTSHPQSTMFKFPSWLGRWFNNINKSAFGRKVFLFPISLISAKWT